MQESLVWAPRQLHGLAVEKEFMRRVSAEPVATGVAAQLERQEIRNAFGFEVQDPDLGTRLLRDEWIVIRLGQRAPSLQACPAAEDRSFFWARPHKGSAPLRFPNRRW